MSLLTWDKPRPRNSRGPALLAAEQQSQAGELTPLRMTLVGAMLIAVGPISMTLYTPALTLLAHLFATTEDAIRTTITVYLFGFALAQLLCGPLSDRFGRRPVVLVCLVLYVVGATVCAGAGSVTMLYLGRLVQGIGACGGMALSRVMVVDRFSGPPAARIISLMSLILSIAPAAAPVLGGTLITIVSWRVLFVMMALYGAGLWLLVWRLPETNARRDPLAIRPRALLGNYRMLLTSRAFLGQIVLTAFAVGGFYTAQTLTPVYSDGASRRVEHDVRLSDRRADGLLSGRRARDKPAAAFRGSAPVGCSRGHVRHVGGAGARRLSASSRSGSPR